MCYNFQGFLNETHYTAKLVPSCKAVDFGWVYIGAKTRLKFEAAKRQKSQESSSSSNSERSTHTRKRKLQQRERKNHEKPVQRRWPRWRERKKHSQLLGGILVGLRGKRGVREKRGKTREEMSERERQERDGYKQLHRNSQFTSFEVRRREQLKCVVQEVQK